MENSYDEEGFKKWEVRVAFIEESYERQGYRMGIPRQVYVSRVLANIRKEEVRKGGKHGV